MLCALKLIIGGKVTIFFLWMQMECKKMLKYYKIRVVSLDNHGFIDY